MLNVFAHALCVKWAPVRHGRPERGHFATASAFIVRQRLGYALQLDMDIVVHHCCCSFQARPLQARPVLVLGINVGQSLPGYYRIGASRKRER